MKSSGRPVLKRGGRIAVVSPASYAQPELIDRGVARLRAFGYDVVVMPNARERGPLYYAGTAEQRVANLHAAFADESIGAIVCTRHSRMRESGRLCVREADGALRSCFLCLMRS